MEAIPRTGDRNLMTMALADERMISFVRGAKTFALGGMFLHLHKKVCPVVGLFVH